MALRYLSMLGSFAEYREIQGLASQNLASYEAVGSVFTIYVDIRKESGAII